MAEVIEEVKKTDKSSGTGAKSNNYKNHNYKRYNNKAKTNNKEFSKDKFKERQNRNYTDRKRDEAKKHFRPDPANETIDDIKEEIVRIEKEVRLEIKEIKTMKLGL